MKVSFSKLLIVALPCVIWSAMPAHAENGVSKDKITVGSSCPLTGPAGALGQAYRDGALAFFKKLNKAGGVNGRHVENIIYDDGYEPEKTVANVKKLAEEDKVFAFLAIAGTPTNKAVLPYLSSSHIPHLGPFSGADFLRQPVIREIFNIRASYSDEAAGFVKFAVDKLGSKDIGIVYQDDAFGTSGKGATAKALADRGLQFKVALPYQRNSLDLNKQVEELKKAAPSAVLVWAIDKVAAEFVNKARELGFKGKFFSISVAATAEFAKLAAQHGEGAYFTQVFPNISESNYAIVKDYQQDMKDAGHSELSTSSLEGYVDAAVMAEALKRAGANPTREGLIKTFESMSDADVGGLKISYSPTNHQGMKETYMVELKGGKFVPVSR